jgi:uncharacterized protein (DUF1810 family)
MNGDDPFDLARFVAAQEPVYSRVLAELTRGRKETHWIWFIFPQLKGLGRSSTAERFGIGSRKEALAYVGNELLRSRLMACTRLVLEHKDARIESIFPCPDDLKFHSSMTLFGEIAPSEPAFGAALKTFFHDEKDRATLTLLTRA